MLTKAPQGHGQYGGQGEYCGLSTATEVFVIFTTQIYSCKCNYNAMAVIS